jgi:hypothetical protein
MKPIRKGANPVKIPFQIKSTDPTLAAWCNEVRTAIRQLESRIPTANIGKPSQGARYVHPWKLLPINDAGTAKLYVARGMLTVHDYYVDASDVLQPFTHEREDLVLLDGTGPLVGPSNSIGGTAGYFTLDDSETYGVWLICYAVASTAAGKPLGYSTDGTVGWIKYEPQEIIASTDYTTQSDADTMTAAGGTYEGRIVFGLGQVVTDADGNSTVTQWRRSDAQTQAAMYFVPVIVSADDPNSIGVGSDGGALYVEPE